MKPKKSEQMPIPKDGTAIWIKLNGGVWWPGFVHDSKGAFYEEEDVEMKLNKSNWKKLISEKEKAKSLAKLKGENRQKYLKDLERIKYKSPASSSNTGLTSASNTGQTSGLSLSSTKPTTASNTKQTTASNTEQTSASNTEQTTASNTEQTTASNTEQTTASNTEQTSASNTEQTTASNTKQTTASNTEQTSASNTEQILASNTEQTSACNTGQTSVLSSSYSEQAVSCTGHVNPTSLETDNTELMDTLELLMSGDVLLSPSNTEQTLASNTGQTSASNKGQTSVLSSSSNDQAKSCTGHVNPMSLDTDNTELMDTSELLMSDDVPLSPSNTEQTLASNTGQTSASNTEQTLASNTEQISASNTEQTSASNTRQTPASNTEQMSASNTEQIASNTEQTSASDTEQTLASNTERTSASNAEQTSASNNERTPAANTERTSASKTGQASASNTEQTSAYNIGQTPASNNEQTSAYNIGHTPASNTERTSASNTEQILASNTSQTSASNTGQILASNTRQTSASNTRQTSASNTGQTSSLSPSNTTKTSVSNSGQTSVLSSSYNKQAVSCTGHINPTSLETDNTEVMDTLELLMSVDVPLSPSNTGQILASNTGRTLASNTEQTLASNTGQASASNTGQASASNTGQTSASNTGQTSASNSGQTSVLSSSYNEQAISCTGHINPTSLETDNTELMDTLELLMSDDVPLSPSNTGQTSVSNTGQSSASSPFSTGKAVPTSLSNTGKAVPTSSSHTAPAHLSCLYVTDIPLTSSFDTVIVSDSGVESEDSIVWPLLNKQKKRTTNNREKSYNLQVNEVCDDEEMDSDEDPPYFPSEDPDSSENDSDHEDIIDISKKKRSIIKGSNACNKKRKVTSSKTTELSSLETAALSSSETAELSSLETAALPSSDITEGIMVSAVEKKDGKRLYDKRQACFFCGFLSSKISKHLENMHSSEADVAKILAKKKNSQERKQMWTLLRNRGNFEHNIKAIGNGGNIIVDRRPGKSKAIEYFLPCPYCLAFVVKEDIWRHTKKCPAVHTERDEKSVTLAATLLLKGCTSNSEERETITILTGMKNDAITECIKHDKLLVILGATMLRKVGKGRKANVRQKLRELGRLLLVLNTSNPPTNMFIHYLTPGNFDTIVTAVKKLCNSEKGETIRGCEEYERPSLALKLGHSLKKLAQIKVGQALREGDENKQKDAENYLKLHEQEWAERISSQAMNTLAERKFNQPDVLPLTEDIVCLRKYLLKEIPLKMEALQQFPEVGIWRQLALLVLCRVCIFNRRRGGEVGAMLLTSYTGRCKADGSEELIASLEPIEQKLMKRLELVEILGKRNRRVPVILTTDMVQGIECLIQNRKAAGVQASNRYLFAAPSSSDSYLKGWDALSSVCQQIPNLKMPHLIKTTNLRKYVATVSQIIDMGQNEELEWLASHMGHSLSVHRSFYRLQEKTLELAKVSKLLMAVDKGVCHKFKGKTLDQMSLEDIEDVAEIEKHEEDEDSENDIENAECNAGTDVDGTSIDLGGDAIYCEDNGVKKVKVKREALNSKQATKTKVQRKPWNKEECDLLRKYFHRNIVNKKPPSRNDVILQGRKNTKLQEVIKERGWKKIKYYTWSLAQQHHKKADSMLNN